ncbi:MAG: YCF48-related protein [Methylibium sp.]|nr:YCF48-related protein [Methylibium sp.]
MSSSRSLIAFACTLCLVIATLPGSAATAGAPRFGVLQQAALQSPRALSSTMLAMAVAGQRLVAVGERGIVLLSDDRGASWRQAATPVQTSLTAVQFVDERHGWAVGHLGVVLHSGDGGETWTKQLDGLQLPALFEQSARADAAAAPAYLDYVQLLADDGPDKPFLALHFQDAKRGIVVGAYNLALTTEDGGATWVPLSARLPNPKSLHLYGIAVSGRSIVMAGEQGLLLRSDNGGRDFAVLESPYKGSWFGLLATRGDRLLVYGLRGAAYVSADRGSSWTQANTELPVSISGAAELADGTLVLGSSAGDLLISRDQGRSFQRRGGPQQPPITGLVPTQDGALALAGLRGPQRLDLTAPVAAR